MFLFLQFVVFISNSPLGCWFGSCLNPSRVNCRMHFYTDYKNKREHLTLFQAYQQTHYIVWLKAVGNSWYGRIWWEEGTKASWEFCPTALTKIEDKYFGRNIEELQLASYVYSKFQSGFSGSHNLYFELATFQLIWALPSCESGDNWTMRGRASLWFR